MFTRGIQTHLPGEAGEARFTHARLLGKSKARKCGRSRVPIARPRSEIGPELPQVKPPPLPLRAAGTLARVAMVTPSPLHTTGKGPCFLWASQPLNTFRAWKQHLQAGNHLKWYRVQFLSAALFLISAFKSLTAKRLSYFLGVSFRVPEDRPHLCEAWFSTPEWRQPPSRNSRDLCLLGLLLLQGIKKHI